MKFAFSRQTHSRIRFAAPIAAIAGSALLAGVVERPASAQTFYTSRTAYNSATTPIQTLDFNNLVGTSQYPNTNGAYRSSSTSGITVSGITFVGYSYGYGYETYLMTSAYSGNAYTLDGSGTVMGGRGYTAITGLGSAQAFGMDFGESNTSGDVSGGQLQVVLANSTSYTYTLTYAHGVSQFIGFSSPISTISAIYLTATDPTGSLPPYPSILDNFTTRAP